MSATSYKFGEYELDCSRFELRRGGHALRLERIPLELLILLAEKQGAVVIRQEIIDRLWGKDVFVDTEHGINTAIRKIRTALREDADHPRFLETVTGKGYRFVAEKNGQQQIAALPPRSRLDPAPPRWGEPPRLSSVPAVSGRSADTATDPLPGRASNSNAKPAAAATLILLLAAAAIIFAFRHRIFPANHANQIHSIAVIPLVNLSGDPSQDYFADGMTDELTTALAKNRNIRVVSHTSTVQYKSVKRPLPEIARDLNVDGILEGSVERSGNRVHMTVQLIYAPTDSHVWAESYDRDPAQAISIPAELSQTIAEQVKVATSPAKPARYINPEAHDAYLRGRYFWLNFDTKQSLIFFQKAIDLQPDYAAAWSGMADSYLFSTLTGGAPQPAMAKALAAAHKAVELDDSLPEAHCSMAGTSFLNWDLALADAEIRRQRSARRQASVRHKRSADDGRANALANAGIRRPAAARIEAGHIDGE